MQYQQRVPVSLRPIAKRLQTLDGYLARALAVSGIEQEQQA